MPYKTKKSSKKKQKNVSMQKGDMRKSFREAAQACKAKLDNVL